MSLSLDYLAEKGLGSIHEHEMQPAQQLWDGLSGIAGVKLFGSLRPDPASDISIPPLRLIKPLAPWPESRDQDNILTNNLAVGLSGFDKFNDGAHFRQYH